VSLRLGLAWLLPALAWLLLAMSARAEAPTTGTILLVVDERAVALATRVAAELETLGFAVQAQTREPDPAELALAARQAGAFAAIGIGPTAAGNVEITVLDRVTGKTLRRELLGRSLEDPTTRELVALRASELLRASLMEIEAPHPPRGELPATPQVTRVASAPETIRRPERRLRLGVEGGALIAPGLSTAPLLQASAGVRLLPALELFVTLGSQLTPGERENAAGRLESTARWLSVGPKLLLLPRSEHSNVALGVDVGFTLLGLTAAGFAEGASYRGQSQFVWSPAGSLGIDSKVRLHKQLWWMLRPALGFATRTLSLRVDGRTVKDWGRPWLWCATGLEVEL
jgi:hypothetical protein